MKRIIEFKKIMAWVLTITMIVGTLPTSVYALESTTDLDKLRVSDEYVETYPNGVIEFSATSIETSEGVGEIEIRLLRKGGTNGEARVQVKAIEVSAAYGRDFEMLEKGFIIDTIVEKDFESSTILESSLEDIKEEPLTVEDDLDDRDRESPDEEEMAIPEDNEMEEEIIEDELVEEEQLPLEDELDDRDTESPDEEVSEAPEDTAVEDELVEGELVEEEPLPLEDELEDRDRETPDEEVREAPEDNGMEEELVEDELVEEETLPLEDELEERDRETPDEEVREAPEDNGMEEELVEDELMEEEILEEEETLPLEEELEDRDTETPAEEEMAMPEDNGMEEEIIEEEIIEEGIIEEEIIEEGFTEEEVGISYTSPLHAMKDRILGETTDMNTPVEGGFRFFGAMNSEEIEVQEALSTILPGASMELVFSEGEAVKVIRLKIVDDDIYEDDEAFNLGLYGVEDAVLGDVCTVGVIIKDNDRPAREKVYLEQSRVFVEDGEGQARFKLMREGNIETFMRFSVRTLAGTAVSGEHYTTLISEGVLLPGQEYKYIDIPIHNTGVEEDRSFSLIVETDRGERLRGKVWIMPSKSIIEDEGPSIVEASPLMMGMDTMMLSSYMGPEEIVVLGKNYSDKSLDDARVSQRGNAVEIELHGGYTRSGYVEYLNQNLVGIDRINMDVKVADINSFASNTEARIRINGQSVKYIHDDWSGTLSFTQFKRISPGKFQFKISSKVWNDGKFRINSISLRKQDIYTSVEPAETFKVDVYRNAHEVSGKLQDEEGNELEIMPGYAYLVDANGNRESVYYRDDIIRLNHQLTQEGELYGAYLWGYELYNHENKSWVAYPGDEFVLTSSIIENHVYSSDSYNNPLRMRPVFRRRPAGTELNILEYGDYRGNFMIGGTLLAGDSVYTGRDENNAVNWKVGDVLEVVMDPAEGFYSKGLVDKLDQPLTGEGRGSLHLPLTASSQYLRPVFERNDAGVTITRDLNNDKIYVFVDKADKSTPWEYEALYGGTEGLKGQARSDKILENYDIVRDDERFSSRQINDLTLGEVVTLYAKVKEDGYIPKWVFRDGSDTILGSDSHVYTTHYGESFSFVMTSKDVEVKAGAVKEEATEYILRGKTVKINNTLKGGTDYEKISLDNPDSYQVLPNVSLSVMTFDDDKYSYVDEVGHRYSISTKSDGNGDFELYVPGILKDHFFSVKTMQGEQVNAVNLTAVNENIYIDLPFRDPDYTVTAIQLKNPDYSDAEVNGSITIPKDPTTAARKVEVRTQTSSNNYRISKVVLNSYSSEGYIRERIELNRLGGSDDIGLGIWTGDLNLAEVAVKGGRFAVEVFDDSGRSRGETETGYVILQEPPDLMINIPAIGKDFRSSGPSDVPVIGSDVPFVPDSYAETTIGDDMELVILSGETLKQAISDNLERFDNESPWDKVLFLTEYMNETYSINLDNKSTNDTKNPMHVGDIDKFPINFDLGIYLKVSTATGEADNGYYTLDYAFVTVALGTGKTHHINTLLFGFPVYMSFGATVWGGGILGIMGQSEDFLPGSFKSYRLIYLLGIYGSEPLEYTGIVDTDPVNQQLLGAIYDQGGFAMERMPDPEDQFLSLDEEEGDIPADVKEAKAEEYREYMAKRLNRLISDNWDFYKDNQAIFELKKAGFTQDLRERIIRYENEYMEPADDVSSKITEDWMKRFNMLLLLESLPQYLRHAPNATFSAVDDSGKIRFDLHLLEDVEGTSVASMISLKPRFMLGAGIGARGHLSIGGSGHINFVLNYQPWDDGRGTIEWSLNLDLDLAVIPLSVALVGDTYTMFETEDYRFSGLDMEDTTKSSARTLSLGSRDLAVLDRAMAKSITASVDRRIPRVTGDGSLDLVRESGLRTLRMDQTPPLIQVPGNDRQFTAQSTKHPQPKLHILDDGRLIIFYINDNPTRGDYDRNSLYYSIYENRAWTSPVEIDEDGTQDVEFTTLKTSDGDIHVVWASAVETFGDRLPDANDMMNSVKLKATVLRADENGAIGLDRLEELMKTDTGYIPGSFGLPRLAHDEKSDKMLLTYKWTDYDTQGTSLDYDDIDGTIGSFIHGPFSTLAYHMYEDGEWVRTYDPSNEVDRTYLDERMDLGGLRFIDAGIRGLENPDIREYSSGVLDQTAYLVYPLDLDGDLGTDNDRELFTKKFDFETEEFQGIIKLTDNIVDEANPQVVVSDHISAILYGMNGEIVKRSLEDLDDEYLNYVDEGGYYVPTAHLEETIWDDDIILGYENQDAAQSFSFTVGEDDNLYLTWNEISREYSDVLGREIEGRYIYVKAYDPKYETVETMDDGSYYIGNWGSSGPIAYGDQVYLNEESLLVTEDGNAVIAVRDFDEKGISSTAGTGTLLRINHLTLMSSVGIEEEETRFYPEKPMTGHQVRLSYALENYGTFPAEKTYLRTFLVTDKLMEEEMGSWSATGSYNGYDILEDTLPRDSYYREIKAEEIDKHLSSGGLIHNEVGFEMPTFERDVDIYIVDWEDGAEDYPNLIHFQVPVEPALVSENVALRLSDDKSRVEITGGITNYGNTPANDVVVELVNRGNYDDGDIVMGGEAEFSSHTDEVIETFNLGDLMPGETVHLGYTIHQGTGDGQVDFRKFFDSQGVIRLELWTEYLDEDGKNQTLELGGYEYDRKDQGSAVISDILIYGEEDGVSLQVGDEETFDFEMVPFDASKNYKLVYRMGKPDVAMIDSSRGVIKGLAEGETEIVVEAYQIRSSSRLSSEGSYYNASGDIITSGGESSDGSEEIKLEPAIVKRIPVRVGGEIEDSVTPERPSRRPRRPEPKEDKAEVTINGQVEDIVVEEGLDEYGEKVLIYKVDEESISAGIESLYQENIGKEVDEKTLKVILPLETDLGSTTVLDGETIKKLSDLEMNLLVSSKDYGYNIPAGAIDFSMIAEKLGVSQDRVEDMAFEIRMHTLPREKTLEMERSSQAQGYEILIPPVNFELVAVVDYLRSESRQLVVSKFNEYVQLIMRIGERADPSKISTGIVFNSDGTHSHVPTEVFQEDGQWYARINSFTNSAYSLIWNPVAVKSVANHWSKEVVDDMAARLIVKNPETFMPDQNITRGEFAEYITRALGINRAGVVEEKRFIDLEITHELAYSIEIATDYGIINGYPDGRFRPDAQISREEAMVMYSRAMDIAGLEEGNVDRINSYNDRESISEWAFDHVRKTVSSGVFNGKTHETINPKDTLTCAEAATAIRNLLVAAGLISD